MQHTCIHVTYLHTQDWRYYKGHALSDEDILKIAEERDAAGNPKLRTCEHHDEGGDTTWTEIYGHDCFWYHKKFQSVPGICAGAEVREQCPAACETKKPCYEERKHYTKYTLWDRIMKLEDSLHHKGMGVICPAEVCLPFCPFLSLPVSLRRALPSLSRSRLPLLLSPVCVQCVYV